ncbi:MAG: hypothetical protein PUB34_06525, partial [Clostridia bacterium]|nr:hypothetical protein [Clostridia bacterium]
VIAAKSILNKTTSNSAFSTVHTNNNTFNSDLSIENKKKMLPEEQAELDRLSDSFFAGMRKVAEYNFEGVDGETRKMKENKYAFTKSFSEQISDYKNGIFPKNDSLIISETPKVWRKVGFNALPVTINQSHVDYAINNTKDSDHFIGETAINNLPSAISNPIAIIQSKSVIKRPIVIVDVGFGAKKIVLPIEVDGYGKVNNVDIDTNAITSVYKKIVRSNNYMMLL